MTAESILAAAGGVKKASRWLLSGADLSWANLSGAAHDRWTTWPAGFAPTEQAP